MKEIVLSAFVKTPSNFGGTQAYTIAFVYTPQGDFVVKGMANQVEKHVKNHYPQRICRMTWWYNGSSRGMWLASKGIYICNRTNLPGHSRYEITVYGMVKNSSPIHTLYVRRVPMKWLDIYNQAT